MTRHSTTFWEAFDKLVAGSRLVIDRPKGTHHPRYSEMVYPVDYGYLENTTSMDGHGIDVWRGTSPTKTIDAVVVTVDLLKRDSEIKILIGCTPEEKKLVMNFHNISELMRGLLVER
jgi:inorganic pyrophosphatase